MFRRLGRFAARRPLYMIGAWLVILVAVLALAPKLADVVNSSQATYLPKDANSQQAQSILKQAFPDTYAQASAVVVVSGPKAARLKAVTDYSTFAAHTLSPAPFTVASDTLTPQLAGALDSHDGQATLIDLGWQQPDSSAAPGDSVRIFVPISPPIPIRASPPKSPATWRSTRTIRPRSIRAR